METNQTVIANIKANLLDPRMQGIALFISDVLFRPNYAADLGIAPTRIYNKHEGAAVTTLENFIDKLTGTSITQRFPYSFEKITGDRVTGYNVVLNDMVIQFNADSSDDADLSSRMNVGLNPNMTYRFQLYMAYMNDGDEVLKVKVSSIRLIAV